MACLFARFLDATVTDPEERIGDLPLMTDQERHQLLVEWNATGGDYRRDVCVHQLFEERVDCVPDAVAAVFEHDRLSYGELDRRSNRIANHLRELEVGPETLVGLCIEPSIDMVVGLLGILKAGGAYVPLDPALPASRLEFVLQDTSAPLVVTQERLLASLPLDAPMTVCLDRDREILERASAARPANSVRPDNALYVIYTSGSTGKPKGVVVEHRQMTHYVRAISQRLGLGDGLSFALVSSLGADLGNTAVFPALCSGGSLHLISRERASDPELLSDYFRFHPIDVLKIVPSHLAALLSSADTAGSLLPRSRLVLGGEAASWSLIDKVVSLAPECAIFNHYGPTEATVGAVAGRVDPAANRAGPNVPLGRPLANVRIYLLDPRGQPVPVGAAGELYIAGDGLARGYLNRPELTRERFLPDGFAGQPGGRLYRTGDRARYRSDGTIEFLGRLDEQVKIRGFRVEPGEIESALVQNSAVLEGAVLVRDDAPSGEKRLVAYVVPKTDAVAGELVSNLRGFLRGRLPEYMVPSTFVPLERLPRLASGKVDRISLAKVQAPGIRASKIFEEPRTDTETKLARIWAEVLRLDRVGIRDNFFDLGGDSILSIHITALASRAGLRITPRQVFEHQTIEQLAAVARRSGPIGASQELVTGPVCLTSIQRRFFELNPPEPSHYNQSILVDAKQEIDPRIAREALAALLVQHDALRLRFAQDSDGWRQANDAPDGNVPLEIHDLAGIEELERAETIELLANRAQRSLDIRRGPLLRVVLFSFQGRPLSKLLFVFHHLAMDAVSETIVLEDFETAYRQIERGKAAVLPPKTTSFRRWAADLARWVAAGGAREELSYWTDCRRILAAPLPVDFHSDDRRAAMQRSVVVGLSAEETRALLRDAPQAYHTQINDFLCAALAQAFADWTGRHSLLLELEGHGREDILEDIDLSRTVGWFTARFPVLLELPAGGAGETLKSIKEQLRRVPGKGIGYGLLRYLSPDSEVRASLARMPQPQVSLNYLGQLDRIFDDSLFTRSRDPKGREWSPEWRLPFLLDINGGIIDGQLQLDWSYNATIHRAATVERVALAFIEALRDLVAHCMSPEAGGYTPSDFPQADLTQSELDDLLAGLV